MFLIEARDKFIWFYTKFWVKQAIFDELLLIIITDLFIVDNSR